MISHTKEENDMTNYNMTKKDLFNAKNASLNIKDYLGEKLTITGCAVMQEDDKEIGYFVADSIGVFGVTSDTLIKSLNDLAELLADAADSGEPTVITVNAAESKSGKTYYTMQVV